MKRLGALTIAALATAFLGTAACGSDDDGLSTAALSSPRATSSTMTTATPSPYPWSDCTLLRPGDAMVAKSFECPEGQAAIDMLNCGNNETYVHLVRTGRDDLEGILGRTQTWRKAEPVPKDDYRTRWARENCHEMD